MPKPNSRATERPWKIDVEKDQSNAAAVAAKLLGPLNRHGNLAPLFGGAIVAGLPEQDRPGIVEYALELRDRTVQVRKGNLCEASDLLLVQALTLDGIFTETARRAAANMGSGYLQAFETYMRLAFKAQAQSRATLEALMKIHQPREQTVKHVHVNEGGQAVVAEHFHQQGGDGQNAKSSKQSHAATAAGECVALPGPDASGNGMPIPSRERQTSMQNARGNKSRAAQGQS